MITPNYFDPQTVRFIAEQNAARHALYQANYGPVNEPGRKVNPIAPNAPVISPNRQPAQGKRPAFPDPFAAFEAAITGKASFVRGYVRRDGRKVNGYWRRPASSA